MSCHDHEGLLGTPQKALDTTDERLATAKPVIYVSASPLPQLPWRCGLEGLWLIVDFFAGSLIIGWEEMGSSVDNPK